MKIKLSIFALSVALFIFFGSNSSTFAQTDQITGGYGDADVKDAEVIKAAKFAIKKQSQNQRTNITLVTINNAQLQVVSGLNYELCLQVNVKKAGKKSVKQFVKAVVYRNLKNKYSLTSLKILKDLAQC